MNQDQQLAHLQARLEQLTRLATQQQIDIALLQKDLAKLVSQRPGDIAVSVTESVNDDSSISTPLADKDARNSIFTETKPPVPEPIPALPPTPQSDVASPQQAPKPSAQSLEAFIGGNLINKIGIFILVIGLGIFVKYAIDNNLIGPAGRVAGSYLAGIALVGLAYRLKAKYLSYSAVLLSGGVATLYFSTYFAYDFYALLPHTLAFGLMMAVTFFTIYAAIGYNQQVIGVMGLVGAYAIPILLSQESGKVAVLLTYIGMINMGVATLAYRKKWTWMNIAAFTTTWLVMIVWFAFSFESATQLPVALGFGTLFFLTFYAVFVFYQLPYEAVRQPNSFFIITNTFFFFLVGYSALEQTAHTHQAAFLSMGIAAVHALVAWLMRQQQRAESIYYLCIGLAILFVTLSVDLYFNGLSVPLLWALEAVVLSWVAFRTRAGFYLYSALILLVISTLGLVQVWEDAYTSSHTVRFLANRYFLTGLGVVASQVGVLWMMEKKRTSEKPLFNSSLLSIFTNGLAAWTLLLFYICVTLEISQFFNQRIVTMEAGAVIDKASRTGLLQNQKYAWQLIFSALYIGGLLLMSRYYFKARGWQVVSLLLGCMVVVSWFSTHLGAMEDIQSVFLTHRSLRWAMSLRYIAYGSVAFCLYTMVSVAHQALDKRAFGRRYMPVLIHFFVISVLSFELRNLVMLRSSEPLRAGETILKAGVSILWGIYALGLVVAGIRLKRRLLRLLGIVLLAITLLKLFLMDITFISQLSKIIAFVGLGVLLLLISFLYQRFKDIILADDQ